jgi:ketosteroid isomerase-like protein
MLFILLTFPTGQEATVERELVELEHQIGQAIVKGDRDFVERVFDAEFFYTGVRGELKTKADILADLKSGELKFELLKFEDIRVRVYGDTAAVTGKATTKGRGPSGEISGQFRYTRVYVKRPGGWRLVLFQGTPIVQQR